MTPLALPQGRIPIGWVIADGQRVPVEVEMQWMLAFTALAERAGGVSGETGIAEFLPLLFAPPAQDLGVQDAMRTVDELRNELSSTRNDLQRLAAQIEDLTASQAVVPGLQDIRSRIETIEDRLQ